MLPIDISKNFEELFGALSKGIDNSKIAKSNQDLSNFYNGLCQHYGNLPKNIQDVVRKTIDNIKCFYCKENIAKETFECDHEFCEVCFDSIKRNKKCICGYESGSVDASIQFYEGCRVCKQKVDYNEASCLHYCSSCATNFFSSGTRSCNICSTDFESLFYEGNCNYCQTYSAKIKRVCKNHYFCEKCSFRSLEMMKCLACNIILDGKYASDILCENYKVCKNCNNFFNRNTIITQKCCNDSFCYKCVSGIDIVKCSCGVVLKKEMV